MNYMILCMLYGFSNAIASSTQMSMSSSTYMKFHLDDIKCSSINPYHNDTKVCKLWKSKMNDGVLCTILTDNTYKLNWQCIPKNIKLKYSDDTINITYNVKNNGDIYMLYALVNYPVYHYIPPINKTSYTMINILFILRTFSFMCMCNYLTYIIWKS